MHIGVIIIKLYRIGGPVYKYQMLYIIVGGLICK